MNRSVCKPAALPPKHSAFRVAMLHIALFGGGILFTGCAHKMLYPINENGKFGYINQSGRIVVEPEHEKAERFENGVGWIYNSTGEGEARVADVFLVNAKGRRMLTIKPLDTPKGIYYHFSSGIYRTWDGQVCVSVGTLGTSLLERRQFFRIDGKHTSSNLYQSVECFHHGLAVVKMDGKFGFANLKGELVISNAFDSAGYFFEKNSRLAMKDEKWGIINRSGQFTVPPKYKMIDLPMGKPAYLVANEVDDEGRWRSHYIDASGRPMLPESFMYAGVFINGFAPVVDKNRKRGIINSKGDFIVPSMFDGAGNFSEGLAPVKEDGKWGFVNESCVFVIRPQFHYANEFFKGFACVRIDDKWGLINRSGEFVVAPQFDWVGEFSEGLASFKLMADMVLLIIPEKSA